MSSSEIMHMKAIKKPSTCIKSTDKERKNLVFMRLSDMTIKSKTKALCANYCKGHTNFLDIDCKVGCLNVTNNPLSLLHNPHIAVEGGMSCSTVHEKCKFL